MTTRYAVTLGENGMVIGDGATRDDALADARKSPDAEDALPLAVVCEYDTSTHEVRMDAGVVQLCRL